MTPPAERPPLRRSVMWTAVANSVYLGSQYGMLMAIAKLGSTTMVGEFSLGLAIVSPVLVLSQMQLRQVFVTDAQGSVPFAAFFWTRAVSGALALAGCGVVVALLGYGLQFQLVTGLLGVTKFAESQSDIVYGSLQRRERMDLVATSMVLRGLLGLAAVVLAMWATASTVGAAAALAAASVLAFVTVDLALLRSRPGGDNLRWRWQTSVVRDLVRTSAPLTVASGFLSLSASVPRYFLEYFHSKAAVALFSVAMAPISLMGLFTGAMSQATLARASVYLQGEQLPAFRSLAARLASLNMIVGAVMVVVLLVAGEQLVRFFFTPEYESAVPLMLILGVGVALSGIAAFGSAVIAAGRRFRLQLVTALVGLIVQVPVCFLLVPRLGLTGAAWAEFGRFAISGLFVHAAGWQIYQRLRAQAKERASNTKPPRILGER